MIKVVIVDDEDHVREHLRTVLRGFPQLEIVGEGSSVQTAITVIQQAKPQLVFLDIDLSDGSGFNVLESLDQIDFKVVFVTAYNQFAIQAFRYNALDYILKPIDVEVLAGAIKRMEKETSKGFVTRDEFNTVLQNMKAKESVKKLIVRNTTAINYLLVKDIVRCEADGNYTTIFMAGGEKVVASKPLKEYDSILPDTFFRVHQSHLINLNFVSRYDKTDGGYLVLEDDSEIPISRRKKEDFFARIEDFLA